MLRLLLLAVLVLVAVPPPAAPQGPPPAVLVLFTDDYRLPAVQQVDLAIRQALGVPSESIDYHPEMMDTVRAPSVRDERLWLEYLGAKHAGTNLKVIVTVGPAALRMLAVERDRLFPGVPVLATSVTANTLRGQAMPAGFVALPMPFDMAETARLARRLQPAAREVVMPVGSSDTDARWRRDLTAGLDEALGGLPVRYLEGQTLAQMKEEVSRLPSTSIVLPLLIFQDAAGVVRTPYDGWRELAAASSAPVYSPFSTTFGAGFVGGYMTTFEDVGRITGEFIRGFLASGTPIEALPRPTIRAQYLVDWRALQRFGLDEARLPAGTDVRFRELTFWQAYRGRVVAAIGFAGLQTALIVALMVQRRRRANAEAEADAHRNSLAHLSRVSLAGEMSASLAHELNQPLTAILSNAQAAQRYLQAPAPDTGTLREIIDDIVADDRRAGEVIARLRAMMKKGPPQFEPLRLDDVVRDVLRLLRHHLDRHAVTVSAKRYGPGLPAVRGDRVQLQQVVLNLLMNAADAVQGLPPGDRLVDVRVARCDDGGVQVSVCDKGRGIPEGHDERVFEPFFTTKAHGMGMGLAICRTIAREHMGRLWAENAPGGGAAFHLVLPQAE